MSEMLNFVAALLIMLPLGGLCLWVSYGLGQRLRVIEETTASLLGIILTPIPFNLIFFIFLRLLHLSHDAEYAFAGILLSGLMGMRAARFHNLNLAKPKPLLDDDPHSSKM